MSNKNVKTKVEEAHLSVRKSDADYVRELASEEVDDKTIRAVFSEMVKVYKKHRAEQEA